MTVPNAFYINSIYTTHTIVIDTLTILKTYEFSLQLFYNCMLNQIENMPTQETNNNIQQTNRRRKKNELK